MPKYFKYMASMSAPTGRQAYLILGGVRDIFHLLENPTLPPVRLGQRVSRPVKPGRGYGPRTALIKHIVLNLVQDLLGGQIRRPSLQLGVEVDADVVLGVVFGEEPQGGILPEGGLGLVKNSGGVEKAFRVLEIALAQLIRTPFLEGKYSRKYDSVSRKTRPSFTNCFTSRFNLFP